MSRRRDNRSVNGVTHDIRGLDPDAPGAEGMFVGVDIQGGEPEMVLVYVQGGCQHEVRMSAGKLHLLRAELSYCAALLAELARPEGDAP